MNPIYKVRNLDLIDPFGYPVYEEDTRVKGQQPGPAPKPNEDSGSKK